MLPLGPLDMGPFIFLSALLWKLASSGILSKLVLVPFGKLGRMMLPLICARGKGFGVSFVLMSMALIN